MMVELPTNEKQEVTIHRVHTPVPNDLVEDLKELCLNLDDLALQETLYESLQKNYHNDQSNASGSASISNHEIGQSSHGGNLSVTTTTLSQLESDEALAQLCQEMENSSADSSLSLSHQSEAGENRSESSTMNGVSGSNDSSGQVRRQDDIDPDIMSHEELLSLEEEMGNERRGLPDELISFLRVQEHRCGLFSRKGKNEECVICKSNFKREKLLTLPCKHCYHSRCIFRWLKENKACPICKEEVFG